MTELEQLWRRKSDHELLAAAARLDEYSERAQQAINAELERRRSPEYLRSLESAAVAAPETFTRHRGTEPPRVYTNSPIWLLERALLAIALMIGFYLFALTIALVLLWIPYAEWRYV